MMEGAKVLRSSGSRRSGINCYTSHDVSFCARRINENFSEAEKEAKRTRRVLANRESARQTIHRRQALHEELAKKVADLSLDNKNMKMEKELVMKEYLSLKENNQQLKDQIASCEVKRAAEIASIEVESSTKLPLLVCNGPPLMPYLWPPWFCYDERSRAPFFVPPYAPFYQLIHPSSDLISDDRDEPTLNRPQALNLCSKATDDVERTSFCRGSKIDVSLSTTDASEKEKEKDAIDTDRNYHAEGQTLGCYADVVHSPPQTLNPCSVVKGQPCTEFGDKLATDPREKLVDAKAGAKARKRRMELRKLKHLHGRQVRPHH